MIAKICNKQSTGGYTLVELLTVLAIVTVLFSLAVPAYRALVTQNQIATQVNQLVAAINFARSEAIHSHQVVTLCKSKDSQSCSGTWSDGWIIFVDRQISGAVVSANDILRVYQALPAGSLLKWVGLRSNDYLQMDPSGATHGQTGTFFYYPQSSQPDLVSKIIVSNTGRVRVENDSG